MFKMSLCYVRLKEASMFSVCLHRVSLVDGASVYKKFQMNMICISLKFPQAIRFYLYFKKIFPNG